MIDLHLHTNVSDGQYSPSDTVMLAAEAGARCVAITDHDRISGLKEGDETAAKLGIDFIPGIEISVQGNRELHILGYFVDYMHPSLVEACEEFVRLRESRSDRIFDYLRKKDVYLTDGQVRGIGRPDFARAMVEAGYVSSVQEAFDKYLGTPEFDSVERSKPTARDGLRMILDAGGIPVLAHPALLRLDDEKLDALVGQLVSDGLRGVECYYSTHAEEQSANYLKLAKRYNLLVTCGSDYHGEKVKPHISICGGSLGMSDESCERILVSLYEEIKNGFH